MSERESAGVRADLPADGAMPAPGWVSEEVGRELPGLRLYTVAASCRRRQRLTGDSPPDVEERLRSLSSHFRGARAIGLRREPVTAAYRTFFRQIGLDPDVQRTPTEAAVLERMLRGGFPTGGLLDDVRTIAMLDTGVPVWALAMGAVDGPLGIRTSQEGESVGSGRDAFAVAAGRLVVADASCAVALLFDEPARSHAPRGNARELCLYALQVPGVPELYVDEALWSARSALESR
jgi:DNA/RNA-binding domain of Phe-tRNA-synthetase-like protein